MFNCLLISAVLAFPQISKAGPEPPKHVETGIVAGTIAAPPPQTLSLPIQVVLLSSQYTELWNSDVQKRLDVYWERYKPAFATHKEFFFEISRLAQKESFNFILARMRRDPSSKISDYLKESTPEGKFEFMNVPFGDYKILAVGKVGEQEVIWQDSVGVHSPIPQFIELTKRAP